MDSRIPIRLYVAAVVTMAGLVIWYGLSYQTPPVSVAAIGVFSVLAVVLELGGVSLAHKARGSVAFIAYLSVAILYGPTWAAALAAGAILLSELLQRKEFIKLVFNVAQRVLGISVGTQVYLLAGGVLPFRSLEADGYAFLLLSLLFFGINSLAVALAIGISTGQPFRQVWNSISKGLLAYDIAASFAAVLMVWAFQRFGVA